MGLAETVELAEAERRQGVRSIVSLQRRQSRSLKKVLAQLDVYTQYVILGRFSGTGVARRNCTIYDDC